MKVFKAATVTSTRRNVTRKGINIKSDGKSIGGIWKVGTGELVFTPNDMFSNLYYPDGYTLNDMKNLTVAIELGIQKYLELKKDRS